MADVTDPGVVNVESQAYPLALNPPQALPPNLGVLVAGSVFAAPALPVPVQNNPRAFFVNVERQSFILPSLSLGVAAPTPPTTNVSAQNVVRQPVLEYVITESGSFQFNANVPTTVSRTIAVVTSFTSVEAGVTSTFYVITFVAGTNLMDFGVDLVGTDALFPNSAPARNPQAVPAGTITKFTNLQIVVDGTNLTGDPPTTNDVVVLDVTRHGDAVVFDLLPTDNDVLISPSPPVAVTTVADARPVANATASSGVVVPFVGSGQRIPLLLYLDLRETAFFPASQGITTLGLPANVNVG